MTYEDLIRIIGGLIFVAVAGFSAWRSVGQAKNRLRAALTCFGLGALLAILSRLAPVGMMPAALGAGLFSGGVIGLAARPGVNIVDAPDPGQPSAVSQRRKATLQKSYSKMSTTFLQQLLAAESRLVPGAADLVRAELERRQIQPPQPGK